MTAHPVNRYLPLLIAGDLPGLLRLFGDVPRVNDPRLGWVEGSRFAPFVTASHLGLIERGARVEHLKTTATISGAVQECRLRLARPAGVVRLPVAISADASGDELVAIRIYHSMWPLIGVRPIRRPVLPSLTGIELPGVVARYHACLARGDVAGSVAQFEGEAVLREPLGEAHEHRGEPALRALFRRWLGQGGRRLEGCALKDDGSSCAVEYNTTAWGHEPIETQAGLTVYQRSRSGLLAEARMYDDVESPPARQ